ncbi:MAG: primosomal protein N' [Limnobacter sp.]|uniref:primosomal protein N' n=1 Tax=Limnobacter sp. TaxID=2003368 RepID=UPI00391A4E4E
MKNSPIQDANESTRRVSPTLVGVLVSVPLPGAFTYSWAFDTPPCFGQRVIVPWGKSRRIGLVQGAVDSVPEGTTIKPVEALLDEGDLLQGEWKALVEFAAQYYHHPLGMAALDCLPKALRVLNAKGDEPVMVRRARKKAMEMTPPQEDAGAARNNTPPVLTDDQQQALRALTDTTGFDPALLYGITGSGKTEVYLHLAQAKIQAGQQVLVLLPEINLTPAAQRLYEERLAPYRVVVQHSGLSEAPRTQHWFEAALGRADVVIATRMGVFTPMPRLGLVIVDEEHDPSYKQQDGIRYHARDLALLLAKLHQVPVVLGSATPSLESWLKAQEQQFKRVDLTRRAVPGARLPQVELINTANFQPKDGLSEPAMKALLATFEAGGQSIVFLNRRGYSPQLACGACGWVANCAHCSAHVVWHKGERALRCHHCGAAQRVPSQCPTCGNQDLTGFGRGTQRIEETLSHLMPGARVLRIDADSTRNKGQMQAMLDQAQSGEADVLVGTQMIAKGHDFSKVSLVLALNVDASLFSHAYRAPERLFAQLMQVAGRAGRRGGEARFLVQTRYPQHPVFEALKAHDYAQFATYELQARREARMPPFAFQATLRADHTQLARCIDFLRTARALGEALVDPDAPVFLCDPVPLTVVKVAGVERAQLLVESESRPALQRFLSRWIEGLYEAGGPVRWFVEVDPTDL